MPQSVKVPCLIRIALFLFLTNLFVQAGIDWHGRDAPPEIIAQAKQLVEQKNYSAVETMIAQVDAQYVNNQGVAYFRSLMGIESAVRDWPRYPAKPDYARIWLEKKILWKIYLTPYSRVEDAGVVQELKNVLGGFGAPAPLGDFDQNQFVALRDDGVAMLEAYRDLLKAHIVADYASKPVRSYESGFIDEEEVARRKSPEGKKETAQLAKNELENTEQNELNASMRRLRRLAKFLIQDAFCWDPQDDVTVNRLLDEFYGDDRERPRVLSELQGRRAMIKAHSK